MEDSMRVKAWEVFMGIVMTAHGVGMIVTEDFSFKGWPIPAWAAYIYAAVGISIIPLAWFLRRCKKHDEEERNGAKRGIGD
jgi:hypothetical protein